MLNQPNNANKIWEYNNPVKIIYTNLKSHIFQKLIEGERNILILCSERTRALSCIKKLQISIPQVNIFSRIEVNPSLESCQEAIHFAFRIKPSLIIAIGGGSVLDTAKVVKLALLRSISEISNIFCNKEFVGKPVKFIAIPTTHGSSSELTMWASIWDKNRKTKISVSDYLLYPDYAVYDVSLMYSLSLSLSIITTLDSLSHSFEALWNKNSNPISDMQAFIAIKLIFDNIAHIKQEISPVQRNNFVLASIHAGLAFSNTKTAAAHAISYPLTSHFNIPHGIACSMTLQPLSYLNYDSIKHKIYYLLDFLNINNIDIFWQSINNSATKFIPFSLKEYNVNANDLSWLIDDAYNNKERMDNNIISLSKKDISKIFNEIMG